LNVGCLRAPSTFMLLKCFGHSGRSACPPFGPCRRGAHLSFRRSQSAGPGSLPLDFFLELVFWGWFDRGKSPAPRPSSPLPVGPLENYCARCVAHYTTYFAQCLRNSTLSWAGPPPPQQSPNTAPLISSPRRGYFPYLMIAIRISPRPGAPGPAFFSTVFSVAESVCLPPGLAPRCPLFLRKNQKTRGKLPVVQIVLQKLRDEFPCHYWFFFFILFFFFFPAADFSRREKCPPPPLLRAARFLFDAVPLSVRREKSNIPQFPQSFFLWRPQHFFTLGFFEKTYRGVMATSIPNPTGGFFRQIRKSGPKCSRSRPRAPRTRGRWSPR